MNTKRKNAGFTLLELVVVVAVMGLISTMAMDVYTDHSNQKRFDATKERLAEIKFAIIGDPMMRVGSQAVLSGFYNDTNRLPNTLSELIYQCRTPAPANIGVPSTDQNDCEVTQGNIWEVNWNGPYLSNIQSAGNALIFSDAWGNSSSDGNFGWTFTSPSTDNLTVRSIGLNRTPGTNGSTNQYENDYPSTTSGQFLITQAEVNVVKARRADKLNGYCVNTTTKTVDTSIKDQFLCSETWANLPTISGYCLDKSAGLIIATIISSGTCTGTDIEWIDT